MRLGIMCGAPGGHLGPDSSLDDIVAFGERVEEMGFSTLWMAHIFGLDAIAALGHVGRATSRIELGTAVTPTYPRHPVTMAQEALTAGAACSGRFTLGVGLSHKVVIEGNFGMSFDKPARHMREYLRALTPLLDGKSIHHQGEQYTIHAQVNFAGAKPVSVLVAALGDRMLHLSGELADGTITWMCGPNTLAEHIIPKIAAGASEAGRPAPRIVAGFPTMLVSTGEVDAAKERIAKDFDIYGTLPSYRAMIDREGLTGPADLAVVGDEDALRKQLGRYRDVGVTDYDAFVVGYDTDAANRTLEFLATEIQ